MTVTALPTPAPARTQTQTAFDTAYAAHIAALPTFISEFNTDAATVNANSTSAAASAATATTQATNAAASATASSASSGVTIWVSGTTYAVGNVRFSPIDFLSYRRKTAGAGTTDPSADTTNWAKLLLSAGIDSTTSITASTTLTSASTGYQYIAMTALGSSVTLPDATTVSIGVPKFFLDNTAGGYPVGIRNSAGTLLMSIAPGGTAFVSCQSISTAAGVWAITGTNLEPGLITIDTTFSSTYAGTRLLQFVAFDSSKSLHFLALSSGFAAVAVDNTTGAVGTPVTVSATASAVPRTAFMITSTTAIVFYSSTTGTLISVVISLSGATTLSVGTASSTLTADGAGVENFSSAPKIAQLAATLYLVSYATATGAGSTTVAAFQVSGGTTVTLGLAVNIIAANNVIDSTTTYPLTATTGLVIYQSGAAAPYTVRAVVVSVTNANPPVCTVGTPQAGGTRQIIGPIASCVLSATKVLVTPDTGNTIVGAQAFTISGTTVSAGAVLTVETVAASSELAYVGSNMPSTRYNPVLFPLTATTALLSYGINQPVSRVAILTESGGTMTSGGILFNSISSAGSSTGGGGRLFPQGSTEFTSIMGGVAATTANTCLAAVPHKISGTTITSGAPLGVLDIVNGQLSSQFAARLSSGDLIFGFASEAGSSGGSRIQVIKSNGDSINNKGSMSMPNIVLGDYPIPNVASNRIIALGRSGRGSTINANSTFQMRLLNIEIAS